MNKKPLMMILLVVMLVAFGTICGTIVFFTTTSTFDNEFVSKPYSTKVTEFFVSPDKWVPGETTDKVVGVENVGEIPIAVRVKLDERWTDSKGRELPLEMNVNGHQEKVAILNFAEDYATNWTLINGWYYYNSDLNANDKTNNLLKSVTFNSNTIVSDSCVNEDSGITCTSKGDGYDNAKYVLTITIETVQADVKESYWGLS